MGKSTPIITTKQNDYQYTKKNHYWIVVIRTAPNYRGPRLRPKKVCKVKPVAVHHNVTFVIDLKYVALKDLGADDNGAWEISCPKQRFQIFREDGRIKSIHHTKDFG